MLSVFGVNDNAMFTILLTGQITIAWRDFSSIFRRKMPNDRVFLMTLDQMHEETCNCSRARVQDFICIICVNFCIYDMVIIINAHRCNFNNPDIYYSIFHIEISFATTTRIAQCK